jgi:hypothetical protein
LTDLHHQVNFSELRYLTEVLAVGTAASIVPIASIHRASSNETFVFNHSGVGSATEPGPVCKDLSQRLLEIQKGIAEDQWGWRWEVTDPHAETVDNGVEITNGVESLVETTGEAKNGELSAVQDQDNAEKVNGAIEQPEESPAVVVDDIKNDRTVVDLKTAVQASVVSVEPPLETAH